MAAVRRLGVILGVCRCRQLHGMPLFRSPVKDNRCIRRGIAVAVGVAAGGACVVLYYPEMSDSEGGKPR